MDVWMLLDENFDLPLCVCDSATELSKVTGIKKQSIYESMSRAKKLHKPCRYIKVYIEEEDEVANTTKCPKCKKRDSMVVDKRDSKKGSLGLIRRRRECEHCGFRWTTMEIPWELGIKMIKIIEDIQSMKMEDD